MNNHDVSSNLIHSGTLTGFNLNDYIDLAPMLWSQPPRHSWLRSNAHELCLRDALEQHLYINETPDQRRQRQLFSHVRVAVSANIYTSLEARFAGDFPANIEAELATLHQEDLNSLQQHNRHIRYRIEPDADLPEDTVRYRFGVAIYVRAEGERAKWHIHFHPPHSINTTLLSDTSIIPLHQEETTLLIGADLYRSSYAFRNWPLSSDAILLITHKVLNPDQPSPCSQVTLRGVSGIDDQGITTTADGWDVHDKQGNRLQLRYSPVPDPDYMKNSHTQMDAQQANAIRFQSNPPHKSEDTVTPQKAGSSEQDTLEPGTVSPVTTTRTTTANHNTYMKNKGATPDKPEAHCNDGSSYTTSGNYTVSGHDFSNDATDHSNKAFNQRDALAVRPSGLLVRGIALPRSALIKRSDGEYYLPLEQLIMPESIHNQSVQANLLLNRHNQLLLEHDGHIDLLCHQQPIQIPGLNLPLCPLPATLQADYLGWLALPCALRLSSMTHPAVVQLNSQQINQALAHHCKLKVPGHNHHTDTELQHGNNLIALRTGSLGRSYLLPRHQHNTRPASSQCLPPLTTIVRDKATAFTLICSQYVLEYCPAE